MIDGERDALGLIVRHGRERNHGAVRALDVDALERIGIALILLRGFHHNVVLVEGLVERRDLDLAEGVRQG